MENYRIQKCSSEKEREDAYHIRTVVFVEEQKVPEELEIDEFEDESIHFVIYDTQDNPVGAARLRSISPTEAKLERICIHIDARKAGLGSQLVREMEKEAIQQGHKIAILYAQQRVEYFYEQLGYVTYSDEPFDDAGIPHVKMKKEL